MPAVKTRPRKVNGLPVISVKPVLSNLSKHQGMDIPLKVMRVVLAGATDKLYGCGECADPLDFTGTWIEVRDHRVAAHGYDLGGGAKTKAARARREAARLAQEQTGPGLPVPPQPDDEELPPVAAVTVEAVTVEEPQQPEAPPIPGADEPVEDPAEIDAYAITSQVVLSAAQTDAMTIGEVRQLAGRLVSYGDLIEVLRLENAELKRDRKAAQAREAQARASLSRVQGGFLAVAQSLAEEMGLVDA